MPKLIRLRVVGGNADELYDVVVVAGMTAGWAREKGGIQTRRLVRDSDRPNTTRMITFFSAPMTGTSW